MKKRLPLVLVALAGVFFWRGGFGLLPVERTITWRLWGDFASIRRVELQLYDGEELLKREQLELPSGAGFEPTSSLALRKGEYRGIVMVWRADAGTPEVHEEKLRLDETSGAFTVP